MPAVHARTGARRRTISEINMVPFIDVMLVLLIIFMVSAPLITTGVVDLPSIGRSKVQPVDPVQVTVRLDGRLLVKGPAAKDDTPATPAQLLARVKAAQGASNAPVVIAADKGVKYEVVIDTMKRLKDGGVERVGLLLKNAGT